MRLGIRYGMCAVLGAGLLATEATAGTISWELRQYTTSGTLLQSGSVASGADLSITLNNTVSQREVLRIWSTIAGGLPDSDLGKLTITGQWGSGGELQILVAGQTSAVPPVPDTWPDFPNSDTITHAGLRDLGLSTTGQNGIYFVDSGDTGLARHTRLAAFTSGDIRGDIDLGQVQRILCGFDPINTHPGTIYANITTRALDDAFGLGNTPSIGEVRPGNGVTGSLTAIGDGTPFNVGQQSTWASIGKIVVGPSTDSGVVGILGDIQASNGWIDQILSTGPIGTSTTHSTITAGFRIGRISTRVEDSTNEPLQRNVYAEVEASAQHVAAPNSVPLSSMDLIETKGNFEGSVQLHNFLGPSGGGYGTPEGRKGIFVRGQFIGDIDVTYDFQYGDMIARSFQGNITIGQMLKGSIVAAGTNGGAEPDGTITSIDIGHYPGNADPDPPFDNHPGFNGISGAAGISEPPFEGSEANRVQWFTQTYHDNDTIDSVIRADRHIGSVNLAAMSDVLALIGGKYSRPRIESPVIDSVHIDEFGAGSIWSGKLGNSTYPSDNELSDDYAVITELVLGCVGPKADLWVQDCPLVEITGDMFGEIHLPYLNTGEVIRIHGRFGDTLQAEHTTGFCGPEGECQYNPHERWGPVQPNETHTPRGFWYSLDDHDADSHNNDPDPFKPRPLYAEILIRQPFMLLGQIILDADNTSGTPRPRNYGFHEVAEPTCDPNGDPADENAHWLGDVEIGTGYGFTAEDMNTPGEPVVISTDSNRASEPKAWAHNVLDQPAYHLGLSTTGTGAVGMVPYDLDHTTSIPESQCLYIHGCTPYPGGEIFMPIISRGDFRESGILPVWFGPVELGSSTPGDQHISMFHCDEFGWPDETYDFGADGSISVAVVPSFPRMVQVLLDSGSLGDATHVPAGRYMLRRCDGCTNHGLICGGISHVEPVHDFVYNFFIDEGDRDLAPCCRGDFNCDGDVGTDADIEAFFACVAGNCPSGTCHSSADFNCDGDVGTDADIESFFRVLAGGPCTN